MWLGFSGLLQPVANSVGWLFIAQGQTNRMFRWSVLAHSVQWRHLASAYLGGVAASYSIAWTFVTLSLLLLLWFTGRIDPVKTKDFYLAAAPIVLVASATTLIIFRYFFSSSNAILSLATAGDITLSFIETLFTLSSGRLILQDLKKNSENLTLNNFKDDLLYGL
jgi:hypothetical protein